MVILNIHQAAKLLGKTPAAMRNGYKRWGLPHFRLGGQIRFTQESLLAWIEQHTVEAPPENLKTTEYTKRARAVAE